jgi:hypothetical protein
MRLRHPIIFLTLLALLVATDPLPWLVYWVQLSIWHWNHGNPY